MSELKIRVLGPIEAEIDETPLRISKSRNREILGLLVSRHGNAVSTRWLIDELWDDPEAGAVGAVRTFIGELRRVIEPDRPARAAPSVLVTVGNGYALRLPVDGVDMWRTERAYGESMRASPESAELQLSAAMSEWRGAAFAEFGSRPWAHSERARLDALRADAVERLADARLALGRPAEVAPLLDEHVVTYPWREGGWRLLALALYRSERPGEALAVLRQARAHLAGALGLEPGTRLAELERNILRQDPILDAPKRNESILLRTAAAHVTVGARAQLEGTSALLAGLAVSGGLAFAAEQRGETIRAAEDLGDAEFAARVISSFDVPGVWTRSDDPVQSAVVVDAALRALATLPPEGSDRLRARLLATVAMESRGTANRGEEAREAERVARRLGDPQLLCFALSALYMQSFDVAGLSAIREGIADELVATAQAAELPTFEIHGHLIRMQALCARDDMPGAAREADTIDELARQHERPLARVFTAWFRHVFMGAATTPPTTLPTTPPSGSEMPGFANGLAAFAELTSALRAGAALPDGDFGPYEPWTRPLLLARSGHDDEASAALDTIPEPPSDLMLEATWVLVAHAALETGHLSAARRALAALAPAIAERAAGSAVVDLGPVAPVVSALAEYTKIRP
ncbi:BTAD domain-containing putative transcriptional regulator [Leifsonia sp. A12D58]|uniref:BTAD domain-containing putative transcriptional regulator n=1 Tax=Leifsonia sp. A12D58 TaxID=3397674 RepID=UPI0039E04725